MNWVLLACFLVSLAVVVVGLAIAGRAVHRLYRATQEAQLQVTPRVEAILAAQEQAMILADRIAARQARMADSMAATAASIADLSDLAGDFLDATDTLTTLPID